MFEARWARDLAEVAERVPAWTRPGPRAFTGGAPGFSAWASADAAAPAEELAAEPAPPQIDAFAEGFSQGYAAGEAALAAERAALAAERAAVVDLAQGLVVLRPEPPADLAQVLAAAVRRLVTQVVGEIALDPALVEDRCARIAALVAEEAGPRRLRVHPEDAARLAGAALPVELVADPALAPGSLRLETDGGWVEDGPALRLERLHALLERLGA